MRGQRQRDAAMAAHAYRKPLRVGCAGGIGIPEAVAAAFVLGVDFILTGSINQCTVEAGSSELVKDRLQEMQVQDTDYAPVGDMFEIGAKVQVLNAAYSSRCAPTSSTSCTGRRSIRSSRSIREPPG